MIDFKHKYLSLSSIIIKMLDLYLDLNVIISNIKIQIKYN